jgi:hypothetical protein
MVIFHSYVSLPEGKSPSLNCFFGAGPDVELSENRVPKIAWPIINGLIKTGVATIRKIICPVTQSNMP